MRRLATSASPGNFVRNAFLGPTSELSENQGKFPAICGLTNSPGDSNARSSLRTVGLVVDIAYKL